MPDLIIPVVPAGTLSKAEQPILSGDGLLLRPWHGGDAATVRAAFDCPRIQRWHVRRMDGDDEALAWIEDGHRRWRTESGARWAVTDGRQVLGQVGLREMSLFEAYAEVSYWTLPDARGAGVAGRALAALCGWSFHTLGLHRLTLQHSTANSGSCRVATKSGFPLEGLLRGSLLHADGWHDAHLHARLRSDA
ncbi:GNAT family N-acetyltransferase [Catellatospora sp. KI3]|uniref:GNAT family N-acetyltransferase n=1 Tax=Catellatospora sp. KI3 TaxID=3041620 RepID=UPI0024824628|nr:GNAT family N-acetyltransferase [Catellatospora sp. KI3]MDI1466004.1 GNAT family N-acetyltransferase [Catellatospora sp. KI3]